MKKTNWKETIRLWLGALLFFAESAVTGCRNLRNLPKKAVALCVAAALVVAMVPAAVLATNLTAYGLYIGGVQVTEGNKDDLAEAINDAANATVATGAATYIPATAEEPATLVLNDFCYQGNGYRYDEWNDTGFYAAIYTLEDLNIVLQGENALACIRTEEDYCVAISCDGMLTISGNTTGSLTINDAYDGIYAYNSATIQGATVEMGNIYCGMYGEDLTIEDSTVTINSEVEGVYVWEDITIKNSIIEIFANESAMNCAPILVDEHKVYSGYTVAGLYEYPESEREDWIYEVPHIQIFREGSERYPVWIDEKQFSKDNLTISDGNGGTATYTPATSTAPATLTLNNFNYTSDGVLAGALERWRAYAVITITEEELNIVLQGKNSIICTGTGDEYTEVFGISGWNFTISGYDGDDSLTVRGEKLGIDGLSVEIDNCTVEAIGGLCAIADIWSGPLVPTLNGTYNVYAGTADDHPLADTTDDEIYNNQYIKIAPTYTVTYVVGEEVVHTECVENGMDVTAVPAIPSKEGYDETAPQWDHDGKNITSNITINAVYTKNAPDEPADVELENPTTGDSAQPAVWVIGMSVCFLAMAALLLDAKRRYAR